MKVRAFNIDYDTDGENVELPQEIFIFIPSIFDTQEEIEEFISDEITDITDFCHFGFEYEQI